MKMFFIIMICLGIGGLIGAGLYLTAPNFEENLVLQEQQEGISLPSTQGTTDGIRYSPNSETTCNENGLCQSTIYPDVVFEELDGEWKTLPEISSINWVNGSWRFVYRNYYVDIEPFAIYNGEYKTMDDLKNAFPNLTPRDYVSFDRFSNKFALEITGLENYPNLLQNIDYFGLRLKDSGGLTWNDVEIDSGNLILKDRIKINFADLKQNGFTLNLVNRTYLLIGNLSAGYSNGTFNLDPQLELTSGNQTEWVEGTESGAGREMQVKWDISSIPTQSSVINATVKYFEDCEGFCTTPPDEDLNLSRIDNQTWTDNELDVTDYDLMTEENQTLERWYGEGYSGTLSNGEWFWVNVSHMVAFEVERENDYVSFRFEDPDGQVTDIGSITKTQTTARVDKLSFPGASWKFRMPNNANTTTRPQMEIWYEPGDTVSPTVNLLYPENDSTIEDPYSTNATMSCMFNDTSVTGSMALYHNAWANHWFEWEKNSTTGLINETYNFTMNLSEWHDAGKLSTTTPSGKGYCTNGTDMWEVDDSDDIRRFYLDEDTGEWIIHGDTFASPDSFIRECSALGDKILLLDVISETSYYYSTDTQTEISSCSVSSIADGGFSTGITFLNETDVILGEDRGTFGRMHHTDISCTDFSQSFDTVGVGPTEIALDSNWLYVHEEGFTDDIITTWVYEDWVGTQGTNISLDAILQDLSYFGITIDPRVENAETIYTSQNSPQEITALSRKLTGNFQWNCKATDEVGNSAFNSTNYTINVGVQNCWTETSWGLFVPDQCVYNGELEVI